MLFSEVLSHWRQNLLAKDFLAACILASWNLSTIVLTSPNRPEGTSGASSRKTLSFSLISDRVFLLDAPLVPSNLFDDAVGTIVDRFEEAKKQAAAFYPQMPLCGHHGCQRQPISLLGGKEGQICSPTKLVDVVCLHLLALIKLFCRSLL